MLVAFAASSIADCKPIDAGWSALRLASPLFIMPFLFVYTPILLNGPVADVVATVVTCTIGIIAYAGMMQGFWLRMASWIHRFMLGAAALLLFIPNFYADAAGIALLVIVTILNLRVENVEIEQQAW
jgi:TRAP-type uncharacterized transport system fused permease subunit